MTRTTAELRQYLAGEWLFENNFKDTSGNGNHGTPTDIEWKPTLRGMKPRFNGSSSKVDCGNNSSLDIIDEYTISIWVKLIKYDNYRDIVGKAASNENRINIEIGDDGTILGYRRTGNVAQVTVKTDVIAIGEWNHLVYTIDTTNQLAKIYQNGVLKDTDTSFTLPTTTSADFVIGHRGTDGSYSNIIVSECINYTTTLTATEVQNLYNETKDAYGVIEAERSYQHNPDDVIDSSDAVGAWGTAKESTTELVDLSGNGNVADIHGAMPSSGFFQGRRFSNGIDHLNCGNVIPANNDFTIVTCVNTSDIDYDTSTIGYTGSIAADSLIIYLSTTFGTALHNIRLFVGTEIAIGSDIRNTGLRIIHIIRSGNNFYVYLDGVLDCSGVSSITLNTHTQIGNVPYTSRAFTDIIINTLIYSNAHSLDDIYLFFNTLARLPFWSINYTDYPDNVTTYTDYLPYSSSVISSGTFKVDDDKLQCVSAGTITYSASYEFDGSEYIKVEIGGVEYAGTGTITQGNTTVSVTQGSNKITITMGTGDTIGKRIDIQFREEV